ncbi:MAG: DUF551 domain-containing protein [Lachnospiraceae bacterium]|nr:DUF551 domain-containing protein [Lachnospiraceae bacterium]
MIDEKKLIEELRPYYDKVLHQNISDDEKLAKHDMLSDVMAEIKKQIKIGGWIPCGERLPEEHDSIFAKFKGTDKWSNAMFEKVSDDVNVTVEFENGKRKTKTLHTVDGKWNGGQRGVKFKVIAWQPLPEAYNG